jgi:hypothetical protein
LEEKFSILSKKGKELLEIFGWKEEQEENTEWDFKPNFI